MQIIMHTTNELFAKQCVEITTLDLEVVIGGEGRISVATAVDWIFFFLQVSGTCGPGAAQSVVNRRSRSGGNFNPMHTPVSL